MKNLGNHVALPEQEQAARQPQHTPGPWKSVNMTSDPRCGSVRGGNGEAVALMPNWLDTDPMAELQANAQLISAAPDLLRACEDCMENRGDWAANMYAAIQKARGNQ